MKIKIYVLVCTMAYFTGFSQSNAVKKIGDVLPDVHFKVINSQKNIAKLSDYKGKIVILDFWSTWCTVCMDLFPHMEALQKKYSDQLSIVLVACGYDKKHYEDWFKVQRSKRTTINLPCAVESDFSNAYFPSSNGLPMEVWLDSNRKVIGVTDQFSVTEGNIEKVINGEMVHMPQKAYGIYQRDIEDAKEDTSSLLMAIKISSYNPNLPGKIIHKVNDSTGTVGAYNLPLLTLLKYSYLEANKVTDPELNQDPYDKRFTIVSLDTSRYKTYSMILSYSAEERDKFSREQLICLDGVFRHIGSEAEMWDKLYKSLRSYGDIELYLKDSLVTGFDVHYAMKVNNPLKSGNRKYILDKYGLETHEGLSIKELKYMLWQSKYCQFVDDSTGVDDDAQFIDCDKEKLISVIENASVEDINAVLNRYGFYIEVRSKMKPNIYLRKL